MLDNLKKGNTMRTIITLLLLSVMTVTAQDIKTIPFVIETNQTKKMEIAFFPIKYYNAAVIRTKIKPLLEKQSKVLSFKFNNTLVLAGYPESIQRVDKVIKQLDSVKPFEATVVKLNSTASHEIYPEIKAMSKSLFPKDVIGEKVTVIESNTTNSLILVGKEENTERLLSYMKLLDIKGGFTSKSLEK